jgi:ribose 5-phosphate isomerase B
MKLIAIASDHAGFDYKELVKAHLNTRGFQVEDFGTHSSATVDYPDYIRPAAESVASGQCIAGIIFGGSGNGEAMVANKVPGIRCAICWNEITGRIAREDFNCNMISFGQRTISAEETIAAVDAWLNAEFKGGKYQMQIDKIEKGL